MTLGNMRELGVRSLAVTCELCHHEAVLQADDWGDTVLASEKAKKDPVPARRDEALLKGSAPS